MLFFLAPAACKPLPDNRNELPGAKAERGLHIIERAGCGACHAIPGLSWPQGRVGPDLDGFAGQAMIAGRFPNRPAYLVRWVQDAPSMAPETAMPAMPITEGEARDVAAYLYTLRR